MLKSECNNNRETTETNEVTRTLQQLTTALAGYSVYRVDAKGGGAFISQRFTLERSFCTSESEQKENYSQTLAVSAQL